MPLTEKQQQILDFINKQTEEKGYPPSVREIGAAVGLSSTATVHGYLQRLAKKGYLDKEISKTRAIRVVKKEPEQKPVDDKYMDVPILGTVILTV